jgi:hypothetical protein
MRKLKTFGITLIFTFYFGFLQAQEFEKTVKNAGSTEVVEKKAQNNNTVRSNRTEAKVVSEPAATSSSSGAAASKRGYDYYKAKSDMNAAGMQNNPKSQAPDHNSSRSNKSSSTVATEQSGENENSGAQETKKK